MENFFLEVINFQMAGGASIEKTWKIGLLKEQNYGSWKGWFKIIVKKMNYDKGRVCVFASI